MKDVRRLRKRIDRLARRGAPPGVPVPSPGPPSVARALAPIVYRRDLPRPTGRRPAPEEPIGPPVRLEEAIAGRPIETPFGRAWYVEEKIPAPCRTVGEAPEDLLFFDIEATGLGSSPLFLIGVMDWDDEKTLTVRQFLARDYSEEAAAIFLFLKDVAKKKELVSFNGKSYDLPYIRMRAAATRLPFHIDLEHHDLIYDARRRWRNVLPNCRLQTLERSICGRPRCGDIPGDEIPDAYHAWVRTGDARDIVRIMEHNLKDLVTLADLMQKIDETPEPDPPEDEETP